MAGSPKKRARKPKESNEEIERARATKTLTDAQLKAKLERIRDLSLQWWEELAEQRKSTGAANASFEKAVTELTRVGNTAAMKASGVVTIKWGADSDEPENPAS
jgi:hypothetical protein